MNKKGFTLLEALLVLFCLSLIIGISGVRSETKFERQNVQLATEQFMDGLEYAQLYSICSKQDVMVLSYKQSGRTVVQFLTVENNAQKNILSFTLPEGVTSPSSLSFTIQGKSGGLNPKVIYLESGIYSMRISMLLGMGRINVEEQVK